LKLSQDLVKTSKFLSLVLRHQPERIGLSLDREGWADVDELIERANTRGMFLTRDIVLEVVRTSDKQRFALDEAGGRIRANQGHSVEVDLGLAPMEPPPVLFHGTAQSSVGSIRQAGLHAGRRHHVHLSPDEPTARKVGSRHGSPVVLRIDAAGMHGEGHRFFRSTNGAWLTDSVPIDFIEFPNETM
jgi:putative RNA 2'-phosphotransferase